MAVRILGFVASFAFSALLARSAGASGAGAYYIAFSVTSIAAILARLGMDSPVLRLVAGAHAADDMGTARAVQAAAWTLCLGASVLIAAALLATAPWVGTTAFSDPELIPPLRIMALGLPAMTLAIISGRALVGLGHVPVGVMVEGGAVPFTQLLLFWGVTQSGGPAGAAAAFAAANTLGLLTGMLLWRRLAGSWAHARADRVGQYRPLLSSSVPLLWVSVLSVAGGLLGTTLLGVLGTTHQAGVYAVCDRIAKTTAVALVSLNTALAPRFARLHRIGRVAEMRRLLRASVLWLCLVAVIVTLPLLAVPELVLSLFGEEFAGAVSPLRWLAIAYGINIATGPVGMLLQMAAQERALRNIHLASTGLHLGAAVALIPVWGITGAAIAKLGAILVHNLLCWSVIRYRVTPLPTQVADGPN